MNKIKWLDNYGGGKVNNFILEMDKQLRPLYEAKIGGKLDWDKIWLFIEPGGVYDFHTYNQEGRSITYNLSANLLGGSNWVPIPLFWIYLPENKHISSLSNIKPGEVRFGIGEILDDTFVKFLLVKKEVTNLKKQKYDVYYDVMMYSALFPHEAHITIRLRENDDITHIVNVLNDAINVWNDDSIEGDFNLPKGERGKFHSFYKIDENDNKNTFYLDSGSTTEGAFEYLLFCLDKKSNSIEELIITGP
jgi:hypothetical protein